MSLPKSVIHYLKGLLCVFENATCVSLSEIAQCSHDSLARVLNGKKFCWQILLKTLSLRTCGKLQGGYLIIDDTIISKPFAKRIENIAWLFDSKVGRSILGLDLVLIVWSNGKITIPLALKVYQKNNGKTRIDLAIELLEEIKKLKIRPKYVTFDSWYASSRIFKVIRESGWQFVTSLKANRLIDGVPLREIQRNPYWMMAGKLNGGLKVVVVRHGAKYFAASNLTLSKREILAAYKGRWEIETVFRMLHSKLGLDQCQARKLTAQIAHFHLCLIAYIVLEEMSFIQSQKIYRIKKHCSFNFKYADNLLNTLFFQGA